jgi:nucleotide sugar dehydrogenase
MATFNTATVGVIGVGYVGEHLVNTFGKAFNVIGFDLSEPRLEFLRSTSHVKNNPRIKLQNYPEGLEQCDLFCISVPTLLRPDNSVNDSYVRAAAKTVEKFAKPGATIVMESSVSVGMTRDVLGHLREKGLFIGFSPERVDPGRIEPPCDEIPKIISGIDKDSLTKVQSFYSPVFKTVVPVSSMETAEMCKLYENCFRMINIAYANEAADECAKHSIDVYEMIRACSTKPFGFMPFYPGLGVGGHCIPVNPFYLATNCDFKLLNHATETTIARPQTKAQELVNKYPNAQNILVIGVAFKPGETYTMNAPGLAFAKALKDVHNKNVDVHDPLVTRGAEDFTQVDFETAVSKVKNNEYDIVCVAMNQLHTDIHGLVDTANAYDVNVAMYCTI